MTISPYEVEYLKALPLFAGLGNDTLHDILGDAVVRVHRRGQTVFNQGDEVDRFFVVLSGWVKLYRIRPDGNAVVLEIFGPGESFAEGAMHQPNGYPATAEMVEDGRLLEVPTAAFRRRIQANPELALNMLSSMAVRLKGFVRRVERTGSQSAPQRVATFLLKYCPSDGDGRDVKVHLPYDKQLIANRLGMKPETFSRAMAKLREIGARTEGHDVTIEDVKALRRFVASE